MIGSQSFVKHVSRDLGEVRRTYMQSKYPEIEILMLGTPTIDRRIENDGE